MKVHLHAFFTLELGKGEKSVSLPGRLAQRKPSVPWGWGTGSAAQGSGRGDNKFALVGKRTQTCQLTPRHYGPIKEVQ
jgi:hypothetical protein